MINCATGLIYCYRVEGIDYLAENALQPLVIGDDDDPWGMNVQGFREVVGRLSLMSPAEGTAFSGVRERVLDSVRVIEDGVVRTVVEAVFSHGCCFTCLQYKLPKQGAEIEVQVRGAGGERRRAACSSSRLRTPFLDGRYSGQVAFGVAELPADGREVVAQKWVGVWLVDGQHALTCVNHGAYGSDFAGGELRLSLLRSPGYAGHPIFDRPVMAQDRFSPRIEQGERYFTSGSTGTPRTRREQIDWEALGHNERPYALSFFPSGAGDAPPPAVKLRDPMIQMMAFKQACQSQDYVIRVFNPTGEPRSTVLEVVPLGIRQEIHLSGFEIKTSEWMPFAEPSAK